MTKSPEEMRSEYEASCTHYRKRGVVYSIDHSVVFNGKTNKGEGINRAKRYITSENLKSYTVK